MGHCCCYDSCCVKHDRVDTNSCRERFYVIEKGIDVNRFIKGRIGKPKRDYGVNALDDAEAMLSLLSEEIIEG